MSIRNLNEEYFGILESYFQPLYRHMIEWDLDYSQMDSFIQKYSVIVEFLYESTDDLIDDLVAFWKKNIGTYKDFLESSDLLKCVYSGDLSPQDLPSFIKKTSLYVDTIVVPDTILNLSMEGFRRGIIDKGYYMGKLIKHACNLLQSKSIFLAETNNPIITVFPINLDLLDNNDRTNLYNKASKKTVSYFNRVGLTNAEGNIEDILESLDRFTNSKDLFTNLKFDALPPRLQTYDKFSTFMEKFQDATSHSAFNTQNLDKSLGTYLYSQFLRCEEHSYFINMISAEPIYDYPLAWDMYNISEYDVKIDGAIINALQKPEFTWITKIPLEIILQIRNEDGLSYLRSMLRNGLTDLKCSKDKDLKDVVRNMSENLKAAQKNQQSDLEKILKRNKISDKKFLTDTGMFLVGLIPALNIPISVFGLSKTIKEYSKDAQNIDADIKELKTKPINLLLAKVE